MVDISWEIESLLFTFSSRPKPVTLFASKACLMSSVPLEEVAVPITKAPFFAKLIAIAAPIPLLAPVTKAILYSSDALIYFPYLFNL